MISQGSFREELIGHSTLAVLGILGLALYSTTYSLVYAGSSSTPVVAVLEMWMVTIHMVSPIVCGGVQALSGPFNHIAVAQSAIFLGIACIVTIVGINCVQQTSSEEGVCSAYYGAAAIPKFAAAGSIAWVWVMYVSSLGCQSVGVLSLGLTDKNALTAASIILLLPYCIVSKLDSTCGGSKWAMSLCSNACNTAGPILVITLSLFFAHGGGLLIAIHQNTIGFICSIIGPLVMIIGSLSLWAVQNGNSQSTAQHLLTAVLSTISFISAIQFISKANSKQQASVSSKSEKSKRPFFSFFSSSGPGSLKAFKNKHLGTTKTRARFSPAIPYQKIG